MPQGRNKKGDLPLQRALVNAINESLVLVVRELSQKAIGTAAKNNLESLSNVQVRGRKKDALSQSWATVGRETFAHSHFSR